MKNYSIKGLQQLESPDELHEFMLHYNWDDGIEIPRTVANNKNCDCGTALMIYWLAGPGFLYQYEGRNDIQRQYEVEQYDLLQEIEGKYLSGFYRNQAILFNPRCDNQNEGYDHTQTYDDIPLRRKIPDEMFEPSIPDVKWDVLGKPIKPNKKINYKEWFKT